MAGRTTWRKHSLEANATDGIIRFLLASQSNTLIDGTSGALITMNVVADASFIGGTIQLENILLVAPDETEIKPANVSYEIATSGIHTVMSSNKQIAPIYTLSGQRLEKPRKGLNIVGGKKVLVK